MCNGTICLKLQNEVWPMFKMRNVAWADAVALECGVCATERARRNRLLGATGRNKTVEFATAPYITHMNKPRVLAAAEKVMHYARSTGSQILWVAANDRATSGSICDLEGIDLQLAKERWLRRYDQDTGGISGFLPLVRQLPVRLTQTVSKLDGGRSLFLIECANIFAALAGNWCRHFPQQFLLTPSALSRTDPAHPSLYSDIQVAPRLLDRPLVHRASV